LGVTLSRDARARAIQLPAWNEALGLPRPWDQQWSLRIQQVLAYETDLLEHDDIFEGSKVVEARTGELVDSAQAARHEGRARGGRRSHPTTPCPPPSPWPTPAAQPVSGRECCARSSASTGRPPVWRRPWAREATGWRPSLTACATCPAGHPGSSSPSPASTGT